MEQQQQQQQPSAREIECHVTVMARRCRDSRRSSGAGQGRAGQGRRMTNDSGNMPPEDRHRRQAAEENSVLRFLHGGPAQAQAALRLRLPRPPCCPPGPTRAGVTSGSGGHAGSDQPCACGSAASVAWRPILTNTVLGGVELERAVAATVTSLSAMGGRIAQDGRQRLQLHASGTIAATATAAVTLAGRQVLIRPLATAMFFRPQTKPGPRSPAPAQARALALANTRHRPRPAPSCALSTGARPANAG